jgi:hypothetical protein
MAILLTGVFGAVGLASPYNGSNLIVSDSYFQITYYNAYSLVIILIGAAILANLIITYSIENRLLRQIQAVGEAIGES